LNISLSRKLLELLHLCAKGVSICTFVLVKQVKWGGHLRAELRRFVRWHLQQYALPTLRRQLQVLRL
jgi:hypothetical protein